MYINSESIDASVEVPYDILAPLITAGSLCRSHTEAWLDHGVQDKGSYPSRHEAASTDLAVHGTAGVHKNMLAKVAHGLRNMINFQQMAEVDCCSLTMFTPIAAWLYKRYHSQPTGINKTSTTSGELTILKMFNSRRIPTWLDENPSCHTTLNKQNAQITKSSQLRGFLLYKKGALLCGEFNSAQVDGWK